MEHQSCRACKVEKPLADYWVRDKLSGRRHAQCIACMTDKRSTPEALAKQRVADRGRYAKNPQKILDKNTRWIQRNLDQHNARTKKWRLANPEKQRQSVNAWVAANAEKMREHRQQYYLANRERIRDAIKAWHDENRVYLRPARAKEQAAKRSRRLSATPVWANSFFIAEAYHLAQLRQQVCGGVWHVDHIVPLQGRTVCGLHVETNLRVIPGVENLRKGNRHWPDMP